MVYLNKPCDEFLSTSLDLKLLQELKLGFHCATLLLKSCQTKHTNIQSIFEILVAVFLSWKFAFTVQNYGGFELKDFFLLRFILYIDAKREWYRRSVLVSEVYRFR